MAGPSYTPCFVPCPHLLHQQTLSVHLSTSTQDLTTLHHHTVTTLRSPIVFLITYFCSWHLYCQSSPEESHQNWRCSVYSTFAMVPVQECKALTMATLLGTLSPVAPQSSSLLLLPGTLVCFSNPGLPERFFPQISIGLIPSHPSGLCSNVTLHKNNVIIISLHTIITIPNT